MILLVMLALATVLCVAGATKISAERARSNDDCRLPAPGTGETAPQNINEDELAIALRRLIRAQANGFRDVRAGTGRNIEGTVTYPCSMPLPGATETVIRVSDDTRPHVSATFYSGKDTATARQKYDDLLLKLKRILSNWHGSEQSDNTASSSARTYRTYLNDSSANITLRLNQYKETGRANVSLTIWSPETLTPIATPKVEATSEWQGGPLEKSARNVVQKFVAHDFDGITQRFDSQLKTRLSSQQVGEGWIALTLQLGPLKSQEQPQSRKSGGYDVVTILCRMERGAIEIEVDFNSRGEIGGLWLRPVNPF